MAAFDDNVVAADPGGGGPQGARHVLHPLFVEPLQRGVSRDEGAPGARGVDAPDEAAALCTMV